MDSDPSLAIGEAGRFRPISPDLDLLPTRHAAREALRSGMARGRGPVAVTGGPGVGKTTLWRSLEAERRAGESWVAIEVTPQVGPSDLYRLIARGLRVDPSGFGRPELLDFLADCSLGVERWILTVDEAQNLDLATSEEVRVLSNRLGEPDGFAAILLVGQSVLVRKLMDRGGMALSSRLATHIHLRPLDADEVGRLLRASDPSTDWPDALVDRIHMATCGLPARVIERGVPFIAKPALLGASSAVSPDWDGPLMGPAKPPIRVEDGLIEVGWTPEADPRSSGVPDIPDVDDEEFVRAPDVPTASEERIDDHYAALQAWHEWATNQGRYPEVIPAHTPYRIPASPRPEPEANSSESATPRVWADEDHGFAPFGRLFSRLPQENEAE